MALITGNTADNHDIRFLELRKARISNSIGSHVVNGIAYSTSHKLIFAITGNDEIAILREDAVMDFEWSKNIHDQIVEPLPFLKLSPGFQLQHVTTSKGNSSILVVLGTRGNALAVSCYDIAALASLTNTSPFSHINLPSASQKNVTSLEWHPECSDSLLAVTCSDGSLITIGINLSEKRAIILCQFNDKYPITCISWSPKGKQLIVGKSNGCITFYKHNNGTGLTEARNIALPEDLKSHSIISCSWILTSLILVTYSKTSVSDPNDLDTRCVLVSCPTKTMPEYHDYGKICFESDVSNIADYRCQFYHLKCNLALFTSSYSPEVSTIGSDVIDVDPSKWSSFILDDDSRIEMLSNDGSEIFPRGVAWSSSSSKILNLSETEKYGGPNVPIVFILNSGGIITPYYAIHKKNLFQDMPVITPVQLSFTGTSTDVPPQSNQQAPRQAAPQPAAVPKQPPQAQVKPVTQQPQQGPKPSPQTEPPKTKPQVVDVNNPFRVAAADEINAMNKLMAEHRARANVVANQVNPECTKEFLALKNDTLSLIDTLAAAEQSLKDVDSEVDILKPWIVNAIHSVENVRSVRSQLEDPKYLSLLTKKPLDEDTSKKLRTIEMLDFFIGQQLREVNTRIDMDFEEFNAKTKSPSEKPSATSQSELLYKAISNNNKVIQALQSKVSELEKLVEMKRYQDDFSLVNSQNRRADRDAPDHGDKYTQQVDDSVSVQGILIKLQEQRIRDSPSAPFEPSSHRAIGLNDKEPSPRSEKYRQSTKDSPSSAVRRRALQDRERPKLPSDSEREERSRQLSQLDNELQQLSLSMQRECQEMMNSEKIRQKQEFNDEISIISKQIDEFAATCDATKASCGTTLATAKTALEYFTNSQRLLGLLDQKVNRFIASADTLIESGAMDAIDVKPHTKDLMKKWSLFKLSFAESLAKISSTVRFLSARKSFDDLIQSGEDLIIKSASTTTVEEMKSLTDELRQFLIQNTNVSNEILNGIKLFDATKNDQMENLLTQRLNKLKSDIGQCIKAMSDSSKALADATALRNAETKKNVTVTKEPTKIPITTVSTPTPTSQKEDPKEVKNLETPILSRSQGSFNLKSEEATPSLSTLSFGGEEAKVSSASETPKSDPPKGLFGSSTFGTPATGSTPTQQSIFGQPAATTTPQTTNTGSLFGTPATQPSPFGAPASSPFQQAQPAFGSPPSFGSPAAFGSSPAFGGAPTFGQTPPMASGFGAPAAFGAAPAFGGSPAFGSMTSPSSFGSVSGGGFASFADKPVGFGALASQQPAAFGGAASSPFGGSAFGAAPAFGSTNTGQTGDQFKSAAFTQARR